MNDRDFSGEQDIAAVAKPGPSARTLSEMLLRLYQAARAEDVDGLRAKVVDCLRACINFDGAAVGAATLIEGRPQIHDSYVWHLPDNLIKLVNAHQRGFMSESAMRHPGRAFRFDHNDFSRFPEKTALLREVGMRQVVAVATVHEVSRLTNFLSLSRRNDEPPFSKTDARWLELLIPHLETMLDMSRVGSIIRHRPQGSVPGWSLAATDIRGILYVAEPGFAEILRREWPRWAGPYLPKELLKCLGQHQSRYEGLAVTINLETQGGQVVVRAAPRSLLDTLTERERAVAQLYAMGNSYKHVAQALNLAPATVRHHLRSIYEKIHVANKAELIQRLHQADNAN